MHTLTKRGQWVNCRHFKLISRMYFVSCFVYCAANKSQLGTVREEILSSLTVPNWLHDPIHFTRHLETAFTTEASWRRFQRAWVSIWWRCRGFENSSMNLIVIIKLYQLGSPTLGWSTIMGEGKHEYHRWENLWQSSVLFFFHRPWKMYG